MVIQGDLIDFLDEYVYDLPIKEIRELVKEFPVLMTEIAFRVRDSIQSDPTITEEFKSDLKNYTMV